ncbi:MAG: HNH endonuclease [Veillonella sp.]|uniref:HNH endonuclease n=1 Tax=Veillonella sp. TaxID=1926307 RepID=UPI0025FB2CC6|nr:HNH endonuclease [Veillonella sp.]MBS4913474.1 HNH endonuclease [Veillonella sp.]
MGERKNWTEDELILTYYYYCQIPIKKINKNTSEIKNIADLIGRTPSSVVYKMLNLRYIESQSQNLPEEGKGLSNGGKLDKKVFFHFLNQWEELTARATEIEQKLSGKSMELKDGINFYPIPEGQTREALINIRINQNFFRNTVLNAYNNTCCITGINTPELLIASHIKPWSESDPKTERTNPCNGLCLNALHDKAFDRGLITVDYKDLTIRISETIGDNDTLSWLKQFDKQKIEEPVRFPPNKEFLQYHNEVIFRS